jgi:hypothetical protein
VNAEAAQVRTGVEPARVGETLLDVTGIDDGLPASHLECGTGTYGRLLRHLGLDPRVLGDAWGYRYRARDDGWPIDGLDPNVRSHDDALRSWYGTESRGLRHVDNDSVWRYARNVLDDGRLLAVTVDLYDWPRSSFHRLRHFPHRVLVAGHRDGEIFVVDGQGPRRTAQWTSIADISAAMTGDALSSVRAGYDGRNQTIDIPRPPADAPPVPVGAADRALPAPHRYLDALRTSTTSYLCGEPDGEHPQGRAAIRQFCLDLAEYSRRLADFPPEQVVPMVSFLGALATQRQFNAMFLGLAAERTGADLDDSTALFGEVARAWNNLFHMFLYGFHAGREMGPLFRRLVQRLVEAARTEAAAIETLHAQLSRVVPDPQEGI